MTLFLSATACQSDENRWPSINFIKFNRDKNININCQTKDEIYFYQDRQFDFPTSQRASAVFPPTYVLYATGQLYDFFHF